MPTELAKKIIEFLNDLPLVNESGGRKGLLHGAGIDQELLNLISIEEPPSLFFQNLIPVLIKYGRLHDERYALEAILQTAKNRVGFEKRKYCDTLISEWHSFVQEQTKINGSNQIETGKFFSECGDSLQQQEFKEETGRNTQQPTLEEILGWLQNKLKTYGCRTIDKDKQSKEGDDIIFIETHSNEIEDFNGNTINLKYLNETQIANVSKKEIFQTHGEELYTINLRTLTTEININQINKKEYQLRLNSMPRENAIKRVRLHRKEVFKGKEDITDHETKPTYHASLDISIYHQEMANRIAKAFQAAIQHCGGTSELF